MNVFINDEIAALDDGASVADAVRRFTAHTEGVAVAVNGEVVRRAEWATRLAADDRVEILVATAGG